MVRFLIEKFFKREMEMIRGLWNGLCLKVANGLGFAWTVACAFWDEGGRIVFWQILLPSFIAVMLFQIYMGH